MKNVSSSEVDNLVLLSFSVASRMTDDIRRSSEGTEEGKEVRRGQGRGEKEGKKRDGTFKRERTITGERRNGEREAGGLTEEEVKGEKRRRSRKEEEDAGKVRSDRLSFKDPLFLHRGSRARPLSLLPALLPDKSNYFL